MKFFSNDIDMCNLDYMYDVAICSYNGEKYIEKQIESILLQTFPPKRIIISDDGSSDNTLDIIKNVFSQYNFDSYEIISGLKKGSVFNFFHVISYCDSDYIFLADQDDVWEKDKAEILLGIFQQNESEIKLVFGDASLINEKEELVYPSFFTYQGLNSNILKDDSILYKNCIQGASCAINRALKDLVIDSLKYIDINNLYMHDWWIGLLARYYGEVYFINKPLIKYRQHSQNQIGVFNHSLRFLSYITRFKYHLKNFKKAILQMKELERFSKEYSKFRMSNLKDKSLREYSQVSKIKIFFIKLLNL